MRHVALRIGDRDLAGSVTTILAGEAGVVTNGTGRPDVVVADDLSDPDGIPTILLDDHNRAIELLQAGASGVLSRNCTAADLLLAIEAVARGFAILPRERPGGGAV